MNIVLLMGRLVRDPSYNKGVLKFTLAIDRPPDKDGNKQTDFPGVTAFGKQAESGARYLHKGRQVTVQGRLETGSYQDKSGKTIYTEEVVANRIEYGDERSTQQAQPQQAARPQDDYEAVDDDLPF